MSKSGDLKARKSAAVAERRRQPRHLCREGGEFRIVGRRWPALHRFCGGNCRAQHRTSASADHGGGRGQAHRLRTPAFTWPLRIVCRLAERLNALAPGDFAKKIAVLESGAEAVENAIKIARYYTKRSAVIAFSGGFHGRTLMTLALTGKVMPYKRGFGPFPAEVYHAEFPQPYRGITTEQALSIWSAYFMAIRPQAVAAILSSRCKARAASMWRR